MEKEGRKKKNSRYKEEKKKKKSLGLHTSREWHRP